MTATARIAKWKRGEFQIAMPHGPESRKGFTYRHLGLADEVVEWTLTHLNTGHSLCHIVAGRKRAMEIGAQIAECGDWSFTDAHGVKQNGLGKRAKLLIGSFDECYRGSGPPKMNATVARRIAAARTEP